MTDKTRVQIELDDDMIKILDEVSKMIHSSNRAETIRRCVVYMYRMQKTIDEIQQRKIPT
jgi:metal-responsive CopG/Arc/MetJ family transcriptional regulator